MIRFADDIVIITENEGDIIIQCVFDEMEGPFKTLKNENKRKKIKILVYVRKPQDVVAEIYLDNRKLDQ